MTRDLPMIRIGGSMINLHIVPVQKFDARQGFISLQAVFVTSPEVNNEL